MAKASIVNPARTAVQMAPAAIITEFVDVFFYDFDERQYAVVGALLTLVIGFVQNFVEERKGRALFKGRVPVPPSED